MVSAHTTAETLNWQRLDKPAAAAALTAIGSVIDPGLFPPIATEVKCLPQPFYRTFMLYRLTNYAAMPAFTMDFLSDNSVYYYLDGAAEPIYRVNERGPISLREDNVLAYLDFFFRNVKADDSDIYLIRDPAKLPFMASLPQQQREELQAHHNAPAVVFDALEDCFKVITTLYYGGGLMRAKIKVGANGSVDIEDLALLLSDMTPYFEHKTPQDYYARA